MTFSEQVQALTNGISSAPDVEELCVTKAAAIFLQAVSIGAGFIILL